MFSQFPLLLRSALVTAALTAAAPAVAQTSNLSGLHDALHLSAAQEPAWRTYAAAITPDPNSEGRRRAAAMLAPTLTTPRRVDLMNAEMDEDVQAVRRQGEAVKAFYAVLSLEQQRAFDRQTLQTGTGSGRQGAPSSQPPLRQPPSGTLRQPAGEP